MEPAPVDDITRARWLARMGPELDDIAASRVQPRRSRRPVWFAIAAVAALAVGIAWRSRGGVAPEATVVDRALLRPYVTTGPADDSTATNLLTNKLSTLAAGAGQLVRASFDHDRDQRVAVVGPARVEVTSASSSEVDLALDGTLLVDAHSDAVVRVTAGGLVIRAQRATFAVQATSPGPTIVFVDRGELTIGAERIGAGDSYGGTASAALVQLLRDHAHAIAPPTDDTGILAVEGTHPVLTRRGAVLGTAPLWARVDRGELELVIAGRTERRASIVVGDRLVRVAASPTGSSGTSASASSSGAAAGSSSSGPATAPSAATGSSSGPATAPSAATGSSSGPATASSAATGSSSGRAAAMGSSSSGPGSSASASPRHAAATAPGAPGDPAAELYGRAEAALRAGDPAMATRLWRELVDVHPASRHAAHALYDLASLARGRDRGEAQGYLRRLLAGSTPAALREPARYLACRLLLEGNELDGAARCFREFRAAFPASSHDAEVLAWLAGHAEAAGDCALATEYARSYPSGPFAARARACKGAP